MRVRDLDTREFHTRLSGPGLTVDLGLFTASVRTCLAETQAGIRRMYADFPLDNSGFADFHVSVHAGRGLHRWWRRQAVFAVDGVEPFRPLPRAQAYPMLEWGLNWCISSRAHDYLILHAAVLATPDDRAVLLPAPPGSGKSTLTAALMLAGWRLLSDELALLDPVSGQVYGLARPLSLKNASIEVIRRRADNAVMTPPVTDTVKGTVCALQPAPESVAAVSRSARPSLLVFPRFENGAELEAERLGRAQAFMYAADHAFNYAVLGETAFRVLADLVEGSAPHALVYGELDSALEWLERMMGGAADARAEPY